MTPTAEAFMLIDTIDNILLRGCADYYSIDQIHQNGLQPLLIKQQAVEDGRHRIK